MRALDRRLNAFIGAEVDKEAKDQIWNTYGLTKEHIAKLADPLIQTYINDQTKPESGTKPPDTPESRIYDLTGRIARLITEKIIPRTAWLQAREFASKTSISDLQTLSQFCYKKADNSVRTYTALIPQVAKTNRSEILHNLVYNRFRELIYTEAERIKSSESRLHECMLMLDMLPFETKRQLVTDELQKAESAVTSSNDEQSVAPE